MANINFFEGFEYDKNGNLITDVKTKKFSEENRTTWNNANNNSQLPRRFWETTFEDHKNELTDEVKEFSVAPNNDHVLILMGHAGCGKTTLMASAMHERVKNGLHAGLYFQMRTLSPTVRSTRSFKASESEIEFYQRLATVPFLCLDEVGTCDDQQLELYFLRTIISLRYDNCLPMMISTNLNWEYFKKFISGDNSNDAILDRLRSISIRKGIVDGSHRGEQ